MSFLKTLQFFSSLLRTSIRASISVRGAFLVESALMIGNNLIFLSMWYIFFMKFKEIKGWTMGDMIALNVIGLGAYGLMLICFGGVKYLSRMIVRGELDPFMTQPKNLLLHLIGSKSLSKGWGHVMTALILIALGGLAKASTLPLIVVGIVCSCCVFTAFTVIAHSLAFWLGPVESLSKKYCESLYLFAFYPTNIYSGGLQLVMFTLIPAGVIGYLPVELLRQFSWLKLLALLGSCAGFLLLAVWIFHAGLKRYESGNQMGMRL